MLRRGGRGCLVLVGILLLVAAAIMVYPLNLSPRVAAQTRGAAAEGLPWLSVKDRSIVDPDGRNVLLRGFNSEALLEYPDRLSGPLDDTDAALIAQAGFDVVRLPLSWSLIEPTRGHISEDYLGRIVDTVKMLNRHGLYVIPDMHFYPNWGPEYGGAGAPAWASAAGWPDIPGVGNDLVRKNFSPAANAATTYFWASSDWQKDYLLCWQAVAARLKAMSGVVGYDLYNEPRPAPMPPPLFEKLWMWPLMSRTIEAIGSVDPNHVFIVEATLFVDLPTWTVPIHAANIVYSPHIYTGTLTPPAFTGDRGRIVGEWQERLREADQMSAALWPGEIGGGHDVDKAVQWADAMLDTADDVGAGWAWWQWRQQDVNWTIRSFDGKSLNRTFLTHLARPYLAAAPDGVRGSRGDGLVGRITIAVTPGHDAGTAELAWPALTLGTPRASGSCLQSSELLNGGTRLALSFRQGQGCLVEVSS